jgi:hypothetical protein
MFHAIGAHGSDARVSVELLQPRHAVQRLDWLADNAVHCEPVSALHFPANRELIRKILQTRPAATSWMRLVGGRIQRFAAKFPTDWKREFLDAYQGKILQQQGNVAAAIAGPNRDKLTY